MVGGCYIAEGTIHIREGRDSNETKLCHVTSTNFHMYHGPLCLDECACACAYAFEWCGWVSGCGRTSQINLRLRLHVCVCINLSMCVDMHKVTFIWPHAHAYINMQMWTLRICSKNGCVDPRIYWRMCVCYVYILRSIYACVYIYIYTYIHSTMAEANV